MRERRDAEDPLTWTMPSANACAGIFLATRDRTPAEKPRAFRDRERLWEAFAREEVVLDETVRCARVVTSVGRHLVWWCLAAAMEPSGEIEEPWDARRIRAALDRIARTVHVEAAARCAEALERLGSHVFARSGYSLSMDDLAAPEGRAARIEDGFTAARALWARYANGEMTDGERINRVVDHWAMIFDIDAKAVRRGARRDDPLVVADAAAIDPDPPAETVIRARRMRGLISDDRGISERPIVHTIGDGFDAHDAMHQWSSFRRGELRQNEADRSVAALFGSLAALAEVRVVERDCGTIHGARIAMEYDGDSPERAVFTASMETRVLAADVSHGGVLLAMAGTVISLELAETIARANVGFVIVRDPIACESRGGVCGRCMGLDPDDFTWLQPGDAIGTRAAQCIAREARKFGRLRTFHIC